MLCRLIPVTNWNHFTWDVNTFQLGCGSAGQDPMSIHLQDLDEEDDKFSFFFFFFFFK